MQRQLFFVVIEDDYRDARFFQRLQIVFNHLPLPVANDEQIRLERQHFFHREGSRFNLADVFQLFQLRQCLAIDFPAGRRPVSPHRFGKADDVVERFFAANGEVIGVIEAEDDALGRHINFHFTSEDVFNGFDFRVRGGHGCGYYGSGKQIFQHRNS